MRVGLVIVLAWFLAVAGAQASPANRGSVPVRRAVRGVPFTFRYDGRPSSELVSGWRRRIDQKSLGHALTHRTTRWHDPKTGLDVRLVEVEYRDSAAVEWTVYLKNTGSKDTPIVEDLQALDAPIEHRSGGELVLHHNVGSPANGSDYAPLVTSMAVGTSLRLTAAGGRPSNTDMPYFNFAWGKGGTIVVVGWPGQWAADFSRDAKGGLRVRAGQELTHFRLHPGEEVRTPLVVVLDYDGDWTDGQNQWRRWMIAHGMPRPGGRLPRPLMLASSSRAYQEMTGADEASQIMHIDRYLEEGLKLDYWWMDAGWYVQQQGWPQVGTWEVDTKRFPHGFKAISDHAHSRGVKILVWFEPERVAPHTWLADNHPEWLLSTVQGLVVRRSSQLGGGEPCVVHNASSHDVSAPGIHWGPGSLSMHPGPKGEYSVVRFTADQSGPYKFDSTYIGFDDKTTTDVHVLHNGRALASSFVLLNGQGRRTPLAASLRMARGDTLDFVVGFGNGSYGFDTTGLEAAVTGPDGRRRDAAKEFGQRPWSYGWSDPGAAPNTQSFHEYDVAEKAGANQNRLLDLGNPRAWSWLVSHIDKLLVDNGIDLYRQDFNIDPLPYWRGNDAPDRQGITENKHVVGYLAYWDELRRRHPGMLIDSCASGGRRNDLETMRRAVPLWRSDYAYEPIGHQCMTYGISMWLPYHGTGTVAVETAPYYGGGVTPVHPYAFWSNAAPALGCGVDVRERGLDYPELRRLFGAWRSISDSYGGDFYPLTDYARRDDDWIAWQFARPANGDGVVQAFRRPKAGQETLNLKLRGLEPGAHYRATVVDGAEVPDRPLTGRELMSEGLPVTIARAPGAAVVKYAKVKSGAPARR